MFELLTAPFAILCGLIGVSLWLALALFWLWTLVDCVQNEPPTGNDKVVWLLVIVLVPWPFGALVYYFFRRPDRIGAYGR
jgi:hypothetical protein